MSKHPTTPPQDLPDDIREQRFAKKAFNLLNYLGVGWLINSSLSLYITYNVLPTKAAQGGIAKLRDGIYSVMSGVMKATNGGKLPPGKQLNYAHDKARSAAEILCMCISGTLLMAPMKWMEDYKQPIVSWIDRRKNAKFYREHPDALAYMQAHDHDPKPEDDRVGWGRIMAARAAGVATNLSADQMIEAFNNHRHQQGLPNVDTAEWALGGQVYEKLPPKTRDGFVQFFSRHDVTVEGIQPMVRERLSHVVGTDPKRMVFAEQGRLFQKEFGLTLLLAGVVYGVSKGKFLPDRKKRAEPAAAAPEPPRNDTPETTWQDRTQRHGVAAPLQQTGPMDRVHAPAQSHTGALAQQAEHSPTEVAP